MADAQLMEEELQQSVMQSEREASLALHEEDGDVEMGEDDDEEDEDDGAFASQSHIDVGEGSADGDGDEDMEDEEEEEEEEEQRREYDEEGEEEEERDEQSGSGGSEGEEEDDAFDEDAEGEDDDEPQPRNHRPQRRSASRAHDDEDGEEDEDEGVGAVKIRPGETDDEDESSEGSASLASGSDGESEGEAEWEAAENDEENEEDEFENAAGLCVFCKQDEEHDPADEFEVFLACTKCGDNAHQQCARENEALSAGDGPENWRCPKCADDLESDGAEDLDEDAKIDGIADADAPPATRRATAPKLARDLLPSQRGAIKPDSHSVFNQLVLDEDPMDGSRVLRKRKTSSVVSDEHIMALRRPRRNTSDAQSIEDATAAQDDSSRPVSRSLRLKIPNAPATVVKNTRTSILVRLRVNSSELRQILSRKPRGPKKRSGRARRRTSRSESTRAPPLPIAAIATPFTPSAYSQPFYSFYDKETDELKGKPYGGILTEAEADTSKTMPTNDDRRRFDEAKQKAEEEWRQRLLKMQSEVEAPAKKSRKASGPASQIECIEFGGWEIDTWYAAPYPEEYSRNRVLYICEFCLKYMNSDYVAWRHKLKCPAKHPPGDEIYRHGSVSVFEVDGRKNPVYCQNLCLLAKLFLGSKTLYYDVEPFLFYVLCEYDDMGYHFVGYFSKEKRASSQNNVSCILTLPIHQRKGYGNLLIDFSYLLTRVENKTGSPEKPLSDMGLVSYRNYWRLIMCRYLLDHFSEDKSGKAGLSVKQISDDTGLTPDDVISALEGLRCLVRDPQTQLYAFRIDFAYCREYVAKWEAKKYVQLNPKALTWTPYVMGRSNATNFELGPALNAIAPREEEDDVKPPAPVEEPVVNGTASQGQLDTPIEEAKVALEAPAAPESTEQPAEAEPDSAQPDTLVNGDVKPNGALANGDPTTEEEKAQHPPAPDQQPEAPKPSVTTTTSSSTSSSSFIPTGSNAWMHPYTSIPATRFEVVPPLTARGRIATDRSRASAVARLPTALRTTTPLGGRRPRSTAARRSTAGGGRLSSSSVRAPRAASSSNGGGGGGSNSKRKPGGTGRGPGRWPKGTKKSDYGNADSGPGLPPAWIAERARLAALAASRKDGGNGGGGGKGGEGVLDTVQVQSPTLGAGGGGGGMGKGEGGEEGDGDVRMGEGDEDGE